MGGFLVFSSVSKEGDFSEEAASASTLHSLQSLKNLLVKHYYETGVCHVRSVTLMQQT